MKEEEEKTQKTQEQKAIHEIVKRIQPKIRHIITMKCETHRNKRDQQNKIYRYAKLTMVR